MSEPLDNLVIDIQYSSSTASSGVDKLTTSLTSLRSAAKGGVGLTAVSKQITNLNTSLSAVKGLDKISGLVTGLNGLQGVGKASGFTSTINSLKKLPTVIDELDKADLGKFNTQVETLVTIMRPLGTEMQKVSNGFSVLPKNIQKAINANAKLTTSNKKINTSYTTLRKNLSLTVAKFIAVVYAIKRVARAIGEWIDKSNQYQENLNLFRVSMGEYYDASLKYAKQVENTLGIDTAQWIRYQAVFQNMTEGFGVASDKAEIMSRNLTQMGYDLASVFNVEVDTAMEKLESALSGQPRPMREWGFDLSEASLKAVALSHGIDKNVEKMSQMEKAQLRYIYLYENMERLGLSGDFARTLEAPANALRVLNSQVGIAKRELGNMFIPMLNKILPVVTAIVKVIRWVASEIASLLGFTMTDIDYSSLENASVGIDDVDASASDALDSVKELKKGLMGFDEINMLPDPNSVSGSASVGAGGGFELDLPDDSEWLGGALEQKSDALFAEYKAKIEPAVEWLRENLDIVKGIAIGIGTAIIAWKIYEAVQKIKGMIRPLEMSLATAKLLGVALGAITIVIGVKIGNSGAKSLARNGINFEGVLKEIVGAVASGIGGAIIGTVAGHPVIGLVVGVAISLVSDVITYADELRNMAQEAYEASDNYKVMSQIISDSDRIIDNSQAGIERLQSNIDKLGDIDSTVGAAKNLADEIYALSDKSNKTAYEMSLMEIKVDTLNGMGIDGLSMSIDETTGKVIETKDSIYDVIAALEEQAKMAALQDILTQAYKDQAAAQYDIEKATRNNAGAWSEYHDAYGDYITLTKDMTEVEKLFSKEVQDAQYRLDRASDAVDDSAIALNNATGEYDAQSDAIKYYSDQLAIANGATSDWASGVTDSKADTVAAMKDYGNNVVDAYYLGAEEKFAEEDSKGGFSRFFSALWQDVKNFLGIHSPSTKFKDIGQNTVQGFWDGAKEKWASLKMWWQGLQLPEFKIKKLKLSWTTEELPGSDWKAKILSALGLPTSIPKLNVEWYAQGGHPTPGQLFIANEAGAEMVGNLGGRSTVANNQDIAAGIEEASYRGFVRAFSGQQGTGGRTTVVPVQINGRTLFEVVVEEHNSTVKATGTTPLLV